MRYKENELDYFRQPIRMKNQKDKNTKIVSYFR